MGKLAGKLLSWVYCKKLSSGSLRIVEKRKLFGLTVFKRVKSGAGVKTTWLKFFDFTRPLSVHDACYKVDGGRFDAADLPLVQAECPLVSVIVPNYNHAPYLRQRLESVYRQTYEHIEVILLDDASSDGSVGILEEYAAKYPDKTRLVVSETNSGKVFRQWNKGLSLARGAYVWIAESDDYCDENFLEELLKGLSRQSVMIAFARSVFMKGGKKIWTQEKYLRDLPFTWTKPFVATAHELVARAFAIKNVIPNVSSAVFRNIGNIPEEVTSIWENMSLCGDWLFYLWLIRGGTVCYMPHVTNYYRVHAGSTSLKVQDTLDYYSEAFRISCFVASHYAVDLSVFESVRENLRQHYRSRHHTEDAAVVDGIYDLDRLAGEARKREPNVVVCGYALTQGGGEVFPIYLANELKRQGLAVTYIDFRNAPCDMGIRQKLDAGIPLVELNSILHLKSVLECLGAEIIHTHEGCTDRAVGTVIGNKEGRCKHIITLHGMYESVKKEDLANILQTVLPSCSTFVYIADKNLLPLQHVRDSIRLRKIGNGLPMEPVVPQQRADFGIEPDAFCVTLASRALFEKGWLEAIEAVEQARASVNRPIHLLLLGDGKCYDRLKDETLPPYIHLLGRRSDVRSFFAMSDLGLLPSRFKGESFPLVLIECLMCGVPVLASDVGEVNNMLSDASGQLAGVVFSLADGQIPVDVLAGHIRELATDEVLYARLKARVPDVVGKFDIRVTARRYIEVYHEALRS